MGVSGALTSTTAGFVRRSDSRTASFLGPSAIPPQTTLTWPSWSVTRSALVTVIPETWARRSGGNSCRIEMAALIPSGSGTSDADMLADLTRVPRGMWVLLFGLVSGAAVLAAAWVLLG